jgi:Tfp pilus assembly protein PilP
MMKLQMKIRHCVKILFLLWIALAVSPSFPALAKTSPIQGGLYSQKQKLNTLFRLSGREDILKNMESVLEVSGNINADALAPGLGDFARRMMRHAYSYESFYRVSKEPFLKNYKPQHVLSAVQWYRSSLGRKIMRLQSEAINPDSQPAMDLFVENLLSAPPSEERIFLIEKIERSLGMTEAGKILYLGYVKLMYPFNKNSQGKRLGKMLRVWGENVTEPIREVVLRGLLFSFKELKDKELEKYIKFLNSEAGTWFNQTTLKGFEKGIKKNLFQAEKVQEDLVKEIESGGPEFPLLKEIAIPGQRYLLIGKRDPFLPLVNESGLVSFSKAETKSKVRLFGDELKDVPPIALMVFDKIEDQHPALYSKLKRFERMINDREELEEMDDDEYAETIENYREALEQAADTKMDESPLQIEYDSLRMTGIIRKKLEAVAMFEIGSTGYAVRQGDRVGPFYGYVDEIQDEQVVVVEKFRNYLGTILTNQKVIDFFQGTTSEGDNNL